MDVPVLDAEGDAAVPDARHLDGLTVHQNEVLVILGPADFVALTQFHPLDLVDLDTTASRRETVGLLAEFLPILPFKDDRAAFVIGARYAQLISLLDA